MRATHNNLPGENLFHISQTTEQHFPEILALATPPVYQDLSTRHDWPVRKPLSIGQSR